MAIAEYVKEKPIIETERVWIRPMTKNDVPALLRWMLDQSIYTYWGKGPGKTDKNPELLFTKEAKPTKSLHMGIALKENDRVIGDLPCDYRSIENFYMKLAKPELESGLGAGKIEEIFRHEAQASS